MKLLTEQFKSKRIVDELESLYDQHTGTKSKLIDYLFTRDETTEFRETLHNSVTLSLQLCFSLLYFVMINNTLHDSTF